MQYALFNFLRIFPSRQTHWYYIIQPTDRYPANPARLLTTIFSQQRGTT
jgi:hypothetical protein